MCGEAPGQSEAKLGVPFIGAAGVYLDRTLARTGIPRTAFTVTNTIWCRPPHNIIKGQEAAQAFCFKAHLEPLIKEQRPKAILALGDSAMRMLTGYEGIMKSRGYVLPGPLGIPTIASFHPAFLMPRRDRPMSIKDPWRLTGALILDIKAAMAPPAPESPGYLEDPHITVVQHWVDKAITTQLPVYFDIETPGKAKVEEDDLLFGMENKITRIGFAQKGLQSLSIPWTAPYIGEAKRLLASGVPLVGWNSYAFDGPLLLAHGAPLKGAHHDAMWMWHFLQSDLPRGLAFVGGIYARSLKPWKHLSMSSPAFYNAQDVEVTRRCHEGIVADLEAKGMLESCDRHMRQLWPILEEAGHRGLLVDQESQKALATELEAICHTLDAEAQALVPKVLFPRKHYKKRPKDKPVEEVVVEGTFKVCSKCGERVSSKSAHQKGKKNPCKGAPLVPQIGNVVEYDEILPFNIGSTSQILAYARYHGHDIPLDPDTKRETMDILTLKKLSQVDPFFRKVIDYREANKTAGTFIFPPDSQGRIHTHYTFAPSSGRLSSKDVNLQNVSHHSTWSKRVRQTIIVPPGMVMLEADSSAIEAVMTGYFAEDPDYMHLARVGIHDYVTCLELGLPFDPKLIKGYRKNHPDYEPARNRNKRVVHGTNYGMIPHTLYHKYPETFAKLKDAKIAQDRYLSACPKLSIWHDQVRAQAANQGYLMNPWGYTHYYYHVYDRRGSFTRLGEDAKRCVSFLPQSSAAAFQKDNALLIGDTWLRDYLPANFLIHDSYCVIVPLELADEAQSMLVSTLTRPIAEMGGLRIGCEVKASHTTWNDLVSVGVYSMV